MTHTPQSSRKFTRGKLARPDFEILEGRTLFALSVAPFDPVQPADPLGAALQLPGTGLNVSATTFVGVSGQAGTYSGFDLTSGDTRLAISDGLLLTTGTAEGALPPNDNFPDEFGTTDESTRLFTPGDPDLTALIGDTTRDANSITLTFTTDPGINSILFDFVFGTEEFPEFVGSEFNDAFAAYLDGTQISFDTNAVPITVNNNFFRLNNSGVTEATDPNVAGSTGVTLDIEYDGLTPTIRTQAPLNLGLPTHTLKFTIADTSDNLLDSGVFISRLQGSAQAISGPVTNLPVPGVFTFDNPTLNVDETQTSATITINRVGGASGQVAVDIFSTNGDATAGQDYAAVPLTTFTFQDAQTSATIVIPLTDDVIAEGDETFTLTLANPTNAAGLGAAPVLTVTIIDNELGVEFAQQDFIFNEGIDTTTATVTVVLTKPAPVTVTVDFATSPGGSATAGSDYAPVTGTLTFAPGQTSQTFSFDIFDDFAQENGTVQVGDATFEGETVTLTLSNPSSPILIGLVNPARAVIVDLDRPPAVVDAAFVTNERFINGVALRYSEAMTEPNVEDLKNYDLFLRKESKKLGGSFTRTRVGILSAVYEPTSRTVTLTTAKPLRENKVYEVVVNTTRFDGVESLLGGEKLDGNYDNIDGDDFTGYISRATKISYFDPNGDQVALRLKGPGKLELFRTVERDARILRMIDTSQDTILTGTFNPTDVTDHRADIRTLLTGTGVRNQLPQPPFSIKRTISGFQIPNT